MPKEVFEKQKRKIFITITLYLLLAFAFFSDYWMDSSVGPLVFIFGILTLIPLTIIYTQEGKRIWSYFWMIPFISLILFNLTLLYGKALGITTSGGIIGFGVFLEGLFWKIIQTESIVILSLLMIILGVILGIIIIYKNNYKDKKSKK